MANVGYFEKFTANSSFYLNLAVKPENQSAGLVPKQKSILLWPFSPEVKMSLVT